MANFIHRNNRKCRTILSYLAKDLYPEKTEKVDLVLSLFALKSPIKTTSFSLRVIGIYLVDTRYTETNMRLYIQGT